VIASVFALLGSRSPVRDLDLTSPIGARAGAGTSVSGHDALLKAVGVPDTRMADGPIWTHVPVRRGIHRITGPSV
jgi:hypothetical protein